MALGLRAGEERDINELLTNGKGKLLKRKIKSVLTFGLGVSLQFPGPEVFPEKLCHPQDNGREDED
jgi:hypothetical protein